MKKKFLIAGFSVLAVTFTCVGIFAVFGSTEPKTEKSDYQNFSNKQKNEELEKEKQEISAELDREIAAGKLNDSSELTRADFSQIDLNREAVRKEEEKLDKLDLNAYPIVAKYCGEEYNRDELVNDYDTEISYMEKMCELYNSGKLTEDEKETLYNYVDRRTGMVKDKDLRVYFVEEIGAPY